MTTDELAAWRQRELERRRLEEDEGQVRLAPPTAFSDAYARERLTSTVEGLLTSGCCGWGRRPTAEEAREAMKAETPSRRQLAIAAAIIGEAGIDDLVLAHLEGAFTWRQLARRIHELGLERAPIARTLNRWTVTPGAEQPATGRPQR
jgi:hypothetical protein